MSSVSKIKLPNNTVVDIADKISGYGKFVHLTSESDMPATPDPDTLYLIDDDGSSGDSVVNAVLYSAQTLTTAQKAQARTNIGIDEIVGNIETLLAAL